MSDLHPRLPRNLLAENQHLVPTDGTEARINHDDCGDSRGRLYLTLRDGLVLGFCHNCGAKGGVHAGVPSIARPPSEWVREPSSTSELKTAQNEDTYMYLRAREVGHISEHRDAAWHTYLALRGVPTDNPLTAWRLADFSEKYGYDYGYHKFAEKGMHRVTYWIHKTDDSYPEFDRYGWRIEDNLYVDSSTGALTRSSFMYNDIEKANAISPLTIDSEREGNTTVVLVEDRLSAIAGSLAVPDMDWACLWGTKLREADLLKLLLRYDTVSTWLDPDLAGKEATHNLRRLISPFRIKPMPGLEYYREPRKQVGRDIITLADTYLRISTP